MDSNLDDGFVELTAEAEGSASEARDEAAARTNLRPRSAAEILDFGIEVVLGRLVAIVGVCALIWLPLRAINPLLVESMTWLQRENSDRVLELLGMVMLGAWTMLAATQLAKVLATTVVTLLVYGELVGKPISLGEALSRTASRIFGLGGVFLISMFVGGMGASMLFVLGMLCPIFLPVALVFYLFFAWRWAVASSALVLENLSVLDALRRSWQLSVGGFWRWLGVATLSIVMLFGFGGVLGLGDDPGVRDELIQNLGIPALVFRWGFVIISSVFAGIATAFEAGFMTVYYLDLRMRREGFDLRMRLERLRSAEASGH
jgi:hypothetical protein